MFNGLFIIIGFITTSAALICGTILFTDYTIHKIKDNIAIRKYRKMRIKQYYVIDKDSGEIRNPNGTLPTDEEELVKILNKAIERKRDFIELKKQLKK